MKKLFIFLALLQACEVFASMPVRVACVGDSITYGAAIENRETYCYPVVLQGLLGDGYKVENFGFNARTMSSCGDYPYMNEQMYADAKAWLPDIVVIMLGTNDTKPQNWNPETFRKDYDSMIREWKRVPSCPDIYVCLPPPVIKGSWGINDSLVVSGVIPAVKQLADHHWLEIIDNYSVLQGRADCFCPDGVHPNAAGAEILAVNVASVLRDNGWPDHPGKKIVFLGDSITDGNWGNGGARPAMDRNNYDYNHIYGHGFQSEIASYYLEKYPQKHLKFYDRGISGDTVYKMSARFDSEVLSLRPDVISILIGINDTHSGPYDNFDFAAWTAEYRSVIDRALKADRNCRIILCTPFIEKRGASGRRDDYWQRRAVVEKMAEIVRDLADEYGFTCVDFFEQMDTMVAKDKSGDRNYWTWDGIHPTPQAHLAMARLWMKKTRLF